MATSSRTAFVAQSARVRGRREREHGCRSRGESRKSNRQACAPLLSLHPLYLLPRPPLVSVESTLASVCVGGASRGATGSSQRAHCQHGFDRSSYRPGGACKHVLGVLPG